MIKINVNSSEELLQIIKQRPERYVKVKMKTDFKEKGSYIMVNIDKKQNDINYKEIKLISNVRRDKNIRFYDDDFNCIKSVSKGYQEELKEIRNLRIFALVVFVLFMTAGYVMSKKKDNFYPSYLSYYLN